MKKAIAYIQQTLKEHYPESEISGFARIIVEHITRKDYRIALLDDKEWSESQIAVVENIINRLKTFEPIQYIVGETEFFGLLFLVDKHTLIPRPETEELVELILNENKKEGLSILDIGTGSGCIAIALAKNVKGGRVLGWDFSEEVLSVALKNSKLNEVEVDFAKVDVLSAYPTNRKFDIIVSNPPYILECEKETMEKNVLDFEPHSALFVPDSLPLLFYERIADIASDLLNKNGKLYFEINQQKGRETVDMLVLKGFINVSLHKDMSGNDRMVKAEVAK